MIECSEKYLLVVYLLVQPVLRPGNKLRHIHNKTLNHNSHLLLLFYLLPAQFYILILLSVVLLLDCLFIFRVLV